MHVLPKGIVKKQPGVSKRSFAKIDDIHHHQAFDNSLQPSILFIALTGKVILVNSAACELLGYSKKEMLNKNRSEIFDETESAYKKMMKERAVSKRSSAFIKILKKNGESFPCKIESALFTGDDGVEKGITTIVDLSESVLHQKNIDVKKEKIVADNIVLAKSKQKVIDIKKEKIVADNITLAKSNQKNIDVKRNKIVADNIVLAKSKQKVIDIKKEKIVAENIITAQAKSDARLAENNQWIKYIAKTSYDVMCDWDIISGEIYVGDSIEEVFGYKVENNTARFSDFHVCLLTEEKEKFLKKLNKALKSDKKIWNDDFMVKRFDGSIASASGRASIIRNGKGKAIRMIGAIQDVSKLEHLQKKLAKQILIHEEDSAKFLLAAKLSFDVIWDWDLSTGEVFIGEGFEELFGYKIKNNKGSSKDLDSHIHPDDKEMVNKGWEKTRASLVTHWEHAYRLVRADGSVARIFNRASIIRNSEGKVCRMIGAMQDISKQEELQERLEKEIRMKGKEISEAKETARENERSTISKELHDNVNQLLGASKMYLEMAKRGDENSQMYFSRSSEYTVTAIEEIRKLTRGLINDIIKNFGLCEAINNISRDTMEINPIKISCSLLSFKEESVDDKFKLNVFRIVQEQINNILKHANATTATISLSSNKTSIILTITDNGIGFDATKKIKGIGIVNIKERAASYNGVATFVTKPALGCVLSVRFTL